MSLRLLIVIFLTLTGCVYAPTYTLHETVSEYTQNTEIRKSVKVSVKTNEVGKERVEHKPPSGAQQVLAECGVFNLPIAGKIPVAPNEKDFDKANSLEEIDHMIAGYISQLRAHISDERSKIEQAHNLWLLSCN